MLKQLQTFFLLFLFSITAKAQADLAIIGNVTVVAPNPVHVGISVTISFNVQNIGNTNAANTQTAILISSPTNSIPTTVIRKVSMEALASGATSNNIQLTFPVPYQITTDGNYNIIVNLNYDETIPETDHLNNIGGVTINVNHDGWAAQNIPYPIIFIHGLIGANTTWDELINSMKNTYGWSYGGNMNFCLNYDQNATTANKANDYHDFTNVSTLHPDDYYTVNFDVNYDGTPYSNSNNNLSNQSAIVKQGLAIRDAISHVLAITGRDKVILVGHSMGGLAAREYLQNPSIWQQPNINHNVAKFVTIGTPHGGSNATDFGIGISGVDLKSEAVRDLRTSYLISSQQGAYLFNGAEDNDYLKDLPVANFYNVDVNCNGLTGEWITGINNKSISTNLSYSCLIGTGQALPIAGDGVVTEYSANVNNFLSVNADLFTLPRISGLPLTTTWHTELTKQFSDIMQGLDEANNNVNSHAYKILSGQLYYGNITYQSVSSPPRDYDNYKINIPSNGSLNIKVYNIPTPVYSIEVRNSSNNSVYSFANNGKGYINTNVSLTAGDYYIVLSGIPTANSYKYPYAFKCTFSQVTTYCNSTTTLTTASGTFSDGSGNNNYNNNSDCKWKIQPSGATSISLNFSNFSISNPGDTLYVYDGGTTTSPLLAALTGNTLPPVITSTSGVLLVRFATDGSNTATGWTANYTSIVVPTYCNGTTTLTATSGNFSDGSGATDYGNNSHCSWLINPPDASSITLSFNHFNTEPTNDIINIYDGNDNTATLLGSYSGNSIPASITSTGGAIFIEFITNDSITTSGWDASYTSYTPYISTGIIQYEYWFDNNYQDVISTDIMPQQSFQLSRNIATNSLSVGLHSLHIRFKDSKGQWSSIVSNYFIKNNTSSSSNKISGYEYWFDNDYGSAVFNTTSLQSNFQLNSNISTSNLPQGLHSFHIRFKDIKGQWSSVLSNFFINKTSTASPKMKSWRYWLDNNSSDIVIKDFTLQQANENLFDTLNCAFLNTGKHYIHFQFQDSLNQWSSVIVDSFNVNQPAIPPIPTSNSPQCAVIITRNGTPPSGVIWYWQGTSCGTDTTLGHDSTYLALASGNYYLRAFELNCGCWSSECSSVSVTINPSTSAIWRGTVSTDWTNGNNWSCGVVPDSAKDITIPSGTPFSPIIPNGIVTECRSLLIMPNAILTVGQNANLKVLH